MIEHLVEKLRTDHNRAITALELIADNNPEMQPHNETLRIELLTRLLQVVDVSDSDLRNRKGIMVWLEQLECRLQVGRGKAFSTDLPVIKVVQHQLDNATADSLR